MSKIPGSRKKAWEKMMKEAVYDAAIEIFKNRQPEKLTMEHIAQAAQVSKGTLYNYFKNKEELILYVLEKTFEPMVTRFENLVSASVAPVEKIETIVSMALSLPDRHGQFFRAILNPEMGLTQKLYTASADRRRRVVTAISKIIDKGIEAGVFRKVDPGRAASMIMGAVMGRNMMRLHDDKSESSEDIAGEFMEILIHGLVLRPEA